MKIWILKFHFKLTATSGKVCIFGHRLLKLRRDPSLLHDCVGILKSCMSLSLASIVGRNICTNKKNLYLKHPVELIAVQGSVIIKQSNIGNLEIFGNSEIYKCMES